MNCSLLHFKLGLIFPKCPYCLFVSLCSLYLRTVKNVNDVLFSRSDECICIFQQLWLQVYNFGTFCEIVSPLPGLTPLALRTSITDCWQVLAILCPDCGLSTGLQVCPSHLFFSIPNEDCVLGLKYTWYLFNKYGTIYNGVQIIFNFFNLTDSLSNITQDCSFKRTCELLQAQKGEHTDHLKEYLNICDSFQNQT